MAMLDDPALVICNGQGRDVHRDRPIARLGESFVIEKPIELERIYAVSQRIGFVRHRHAGTTASRGSGKWESSVVTAQSSV